MEEVWREARWIMEALQYARYKQPSGGISVSWIIDFSRDVVPEKPRSTSSQLDYLPSPLPSPETGRKHNSGEPRHPFLDGTACDSASIPDRLAWGPS